jgi:hypothetical protein
MLSFEKVSGIVSGERWAADKLTVILFVGNVGGIRWSNVGQIPMMLGHHMAAELADFGSSPEKHEFDSQNRVERSVPQKEPRWHFFGVLQRTSPPIDRTVIRKWPSGSPTVCDLR